MESETPTIVRSDAQFPDTRKAAAAIRFGTILPAWAWSCLFCASLLVLLLRLWRADLHVPLLYGGDALLFLSMAKGMIEGHWIWFNPHLGLPFGFDLRDLPIFITLDGAVMKGLTFLSHSPGRIVNLTWLLGTVLASGSMTWCLKRFSINSGVAICGGVIYALQPYGFYCGIQHLHSMFYLVPFIATGAIELVSGRMLRNKTGALPLTGALRLRELVRSVPAYLWLACIGIGISYVYTAFFSCFLLFIGGLLALAIRRRFHEFAVALLMVVLICGVQLVNLSPALYYQAVNGKNFAMDFKTPAEEEAYGLEIQHLLTPIPHNPFPALRHVEETMAKSGFEQPVENTYAKLGLIGSAGFLFLVAFILVVPITRSGGLERNDHLLGASAALMLPCLLLGTIGGFGAFFNVFVMPDIRCYNRIVPFIEYFCVAAVALILVRVEGWWFRRRWPKNLFAVILASITIFAGTDQAMVFDYVQYGPRQETFYRDGAFVKKIEATLPDGGAVFELPYTPFPLDTATVGKVGYYEQAKPYLHSKKLGWSWGVMQGRAGDEWVRRVVALSVPNMLHELVHAGFSGLWLDQFGYINGDSPQGQISQVLETAAMRDSTGRFLFYDLRPFAAKVTREESKMSPAELLALHPV
ncbi:MAG: hypothetical protein JO033_26315, partial [Acidobacteriaceae bacterium]|nr:hypothetical protein [Acidobacteriaceae bacterium]